MNITASVITGLMGLIVGLTGFVYTLQNPSLGSVEQGSEYQSTVITSADTGTSSVRSISGTVGSVVVTDSSTDVGTIKLFDTASTTIATTSLTAYIEVDTASSESTYTFDVGFGQGIYLDVPTGFNGNAVITFR